MIIYNGREITPRYMEKDENVIEINSQLSLAELLTMLRAGEDLSEVAAIAAYATGEGAFVRQGEVDKEKDSYAGRILSEEEMEDLIEAEAAEEAEAELAGGKKRSKVFQAFEAFQFNRPWRSMPFRTVEYDREFLIKNIYAALGIMPTLTRVADKTVQELQALSAVGDRLYWSFTDVAATNRLPELDDIEFYNQLNDYEKRIINMSGVHPGKMLELTRLIKDKDKAKLLTAEDERRMHDISSPELVAWGSVVPGFTWKKVSAIAGHLHSKEDASVYAWSETDIRMADKDKRRQSTATLFLDIEAFHAYLASKILPSPDMDFAETIYGNHTIAEENGYDGQWMKKANFATFAQVMYSYHVYQDEAWARDLYTTQESYKEFGKYYQELWNKEFLPAYQDGYRQEDIEEFAKSKQKTLAPQIIQKAETYFKELYRGHAPRVLSEYMYAQLTVRGWDVHNVTDAQLKQIAEEFSQTSVSKMAKYKNAALFALAHVMNFAEIRAEHAEVMGIYLTPERVKLLIEKDFVAWYNKNKSVNTSDLVALLQESDNIARFNQNKSAKDIVFELKNARGISEARKMEEKYRYRFADNELAIRGRHVAASEGKMKMYMLQADDYRNFTIGIDTHCCQCYGNAGETCVYKYTTDPFAGAVVIERNGEILAQGFVWTDETKDTLVFDNVEFANDRNVSQFSDLFAAWCRAMPYSNIHVGTGYNQSMKGWGKQIEEKEKATLPTTLADGRCYSDYHGDARTLKRNGQMLVSERNPIRITTKPDEPTRWDALARPETAMWLNDCHSTIEERIAFAERFLNNPSPEVQMEAVQKDARMIQYIEHPTEEVQMYAVGRDAKFAELIQNPCHRVQEMLVDRDPNYIRKINNPSEEMALRAVQSNGLLLEAISNPSEEVCKAAVRENGYAIRFVAQPSEELQRLAVRQSPKVVSLISYASESVKRLAISEDPHVISLLHEPSYELQMLAVNADPYIINEINSPERGAVRRAIEKCGLLIRNFQYQYPELRRVALEQNGFAIRTLNDPTHEEYLIAVRQNRAVLNSIRNPQLQADLMAALEERDCDTENEIDFS